jgi:hypothetical protein
MKINLRAIQDRINLILFNHPKISFSDMKAINQIFEKLKKVKDVRIE